MIENDGKMDLFLPVLCWGYAWGVAEITRSLTTIYATL